MYLEKVSNLPEHCGAGPRCCCFVSRPTLSDATRVAQNAIPAKRAVQPTHELGQSDRLCKAKVYE